MVETGKVDQLIICIKDDTSEEGIPVGSVYIRDIDWNHNKAEYGIFIGEESVRGKGIGSDIMLNCREKNVEKVSYCQIYGRNAKCRPFLLMRIIKS